MPNKIELSKRDTKALVREYNKGASIGTLTDNWDISIPVVRRLLVDAGVTIRPRGPVPA